MNSIILPTLRIGGSAGKFARELRTAHASKDKRRECQLIESIPDQWSFFGSRAEIVYEEVRIVAHGIGGSGINTCGIYSVSVTWPDGTPGILGKYSAGGELRLPNYVPASDRLKRRSGPPAVCTALHRR
jgi:hypothetical protein